MNAKLLLYFFVIDKNPSIMLVYDECILFRQAKNLLAPDCVSQTFFSSDFQIKTSKRSKCGWKIIDRDVKCGIFHGMRNQKRCSGGMIYVLVMVTTVNGMEKYDR